MAMEMYIKIEGDEDTTIRFPVLPPTYERSLSWNNQQIDVNKIGTVNLIGKPGLQTVQIDAFFPSVYNSSYIQVGEEQMLEPYDYVDAIEAMEGQICHFTLIGGERTTSGGETRANGIDFPVLIDQFNYSEKDGTRDVFYSLMLSEYKPLETTRVAVKTTKRKTYKTKNKDTLKQISKKQLKDASKGKVIYNNNIKKCSKAFKKKYAKQNKKKALVNKMFPKGIKLVIPK